MSVRAKRAAMMAGALAAGALSLGIAAGALAESLYSPDTYVAMTSDRRALRQGDVLTVLIVENASAVASADTNADKKAGVSLSAKTPSIDKTATAALSDDFSGSGKIQRTGKLLGTITVVVQSVDSFGNLVIKGEQLIALNGEKQEIRLEGRVRPGDILENNSVVSTRIADARISYIGDGILGDRQRQGLISRVLTWLGLL